MYKKFDNAIAATHPKCSQLFFVFSGLMRQIGGMAPLDFLRNTKLDDRNVVLFKDPNKAGYRHGISDEVPSLDALVEWQRQYAAGLPYVRDVYCIGVSAGAFPAIYSGYHLKAKAVWTFGARPLGPEFWGRESGAIKKKRDAEAQGHDGADDSVIEPVGDSAEELLRELDLDMVTTVRDLLSTTNGTTEYHLCYVPTNDCDSLAHTMISDLPSTISHEITPAADYPHKTKENWDHAVLSILNHQGTLPSLFPPFA